MTFLVGEETPERTSADLIKNETPKRTRSDSNRSEEDESVKTSPKKKIKRRHYKPLQIFSKRRPLTDVQQDPLPILRSPLTDVQQDPLPILRRHLTDVQQNPLQIKDSATQQPLATKEDSSEHLAKAYAGQLNEMSRLQRCIAEKLISDVMFYGKLDKLTITSSINLANTIQYPQTSTQASSMASSSPEYSYEIE